MAQWAPRGERRLPSLDQVEGPATPAVLQDLVDLSSDQLQQYTARYNDHIAATKSVRDSLRTTMQTMRAEFEGGDRESARQHGPIAERLWKDLSPDDEAFSKGLKDLLSKKQLEQYQKWEKEQAPPEHWGRDQGPPPGGDETGRM
jgi:phage-related minor tail protein